MTLAEISVAMSVGGVLAAGATMAIINSGRAFREQSARYAEQNTLRTGLLLVTGELERSSWRHLSPGGDMIRYAIPRASGLVCRPAAAGATSLHLGATRAILRLPSLADSLVIQYFAGDSTLRAGARLAEVPSVECGPVALTSGLPRDVPAGSPVHFTETVEIESYRGSDGRWWLGLRTLQPDGSWSVRQPVVGPLAPRGFSVRERLNGAALDVTIVASSRHQGATSGSVTVAVQP